MPQKFLKMSRVRLIVALSALFLQACQSENTDDTSSTTTTGKVNALTSSLSIEYQPTKKLVFNWQEVGKASFYRLQENVDGKSGFQQIGDDLPKGTTSYTHIVPLHERINAQYLLQACAEEGCVDSETVSVEMAKLVNSVGYIKSDSPEAREFFGRDVVLSDDGKTLAVSAPTNYYHGKAYVFTRSGDQWQQEAALTEYQNNSVNSFSDQIALSGDGNTLAVSANPYSYGDVFIYQRIAGKWTLQNHLTSSLKNESDSTANFGSALSLSKNGDILAVGAEGETLNSVKSGTVHLYQKVEGNWQEAGYIQAKTPYAEQKFGHSVSLSSDGTTLSVGAKGNGTNATSSNNYTGPMGAAFVFKNTTGNWQQEAELTLPEVEGYFDHTANVVLSGNGHRLVAASDYNTYDKLFVYGDSTGSWAKETYLVSDSSEIIKSGSDFALNEDGTVMAISASDDDTVDTGIAEEFEQTGKTDSGTVFLMHYVDGYWFQKAQLKAPNADEDDRFGSVSLSSDGQTLAVGVFYEDSASSGINGDQDNNNLGDSGAVYLY